MKVRKRLSKVIAGITAVLLALTPLPFEEMGIHGNGVAVSVSAEENGTGASEGGAPNGDETNGGETTGGETNGGETTGGETNGGETTGGETTGGETNGGETNGDETTGGETTGGETNGGETNGDETNGRETNGGETNGDETNSKKSDEGEILLNFASLDIPDNDELFEGYVYRAFYGNTSFYANQGSGYNSLSTDAEKEIYALLNPELTKIANGERESTAIVVTPTNLWDFTSDSLHRLITAILTDFPYDVYWYDKNVKFGDVSGDTLTVKINGDVAEGDVIAAITGDYIWGEIKIDGSSLVVARSDKNLAAVSGASVIPVMEYKGRPYASRPYDTLENAIKDINRLNNKDAVYVVKATPHNAANKFSQIKLNA